MGLIATNTIAQGDTRTSGLCWICLHGATIYSARKRTKWPGVAAVVVSLVHLLKGVFTGRKLLDGRPVSKITAFLFANGGNEDPMPLAANAYKSFNGSKIYGQGFTFDDSGPADDTTPGTPSPIATLERLITRNGEVKKVIFPYIGGEEVNSSPTHAYHRYTIDFRDRSEEECHREWPDLLNIVEGKVRPERQRRKPNGELVLRSPLPEKWWQHGDRRPALYEAVNDCVEVCITGLIRKHHAFALVKKGMVYAHTTIVFPLLHKGYFSILQSSIHWFWSDFQGASLEDRPIYTPTTCFQTFPFPWNLQEQSAKSTLVNKCLEQTCLAGKAYHQIRSELMIANSEGLTDTYNRFHDPSETSPGLLELRRLHREMDQAVLQAYGWSDVPTACGFGLDYLDTDEDAQLPDALQERIDSGELFFWDAGDALDFQGQLEAYGAISGRRKLPWRYRWPDAVRDDVLARLLALNAERYAEEVAQGLHSKGSKKAAGPAAPGGKRRGRSPKSAQAGETEARQAEQRGLVL